MAVVFHTAVISFGPLNRFQVNKNLLGAGRCPGLCGTGKDAGTHTFALAIAFAHCFVTVNDQASLNMFQTRKQKENIHAVMFVIYISPNYFSSILQNHN